jgi:16S rRNA (adenine1518-N6/adenine1519-N6)-dimethyltransferase
MNYFGTCTRLFGVPKNRFYPAPKVDSAVIRIDLYKEKPAVPADEQLFFRVIRAAFGQRRKTLPNALSSQFTDISKTELAGAVESCGFSPDIRGERLSCADFVRLSDEIGRRMKNV